MTVRLQHLLIAAALAVVICFGIVWGGFINVGASTGHWPITEWFLHVAMRQSVAMQSAGIEAPPLDDPGMVRRGAAHFETGCAPCHGSPARPQGAEVKGMTPVPPPLRHVADDWTPEQLFWIVKHGIKFTGMPAWPTQHRDDEVWSMVAFLLRLEEIGGGTYLSLAYGERAGEDAAVSEADLSRSGIEIASDCVRCHGEDGSGHPDAAFPRLDIQSETYLLYALRSFRDDSRESGIMASVVGNLNDAELEYLAQHYGGIDAGPAGSEVRADQPMLVAGQAIGSLGIPARGIGACDGCHAIEGAPARPEFPVLAGQYEPYLSNQLKLFASNRGGGSFNQLMVMAAHDLTESEISSVAAWYSAQ